MVGLGDACDDVLRGLVAFHVVDGQAAVRADGCVEVRFDDFLLRFEAGEADGPVSAGAPGEHVVSVVGGEVVGVAVLRVDGDAVFGEVAERLLSGCGTPVLAEGADVLSDVVPVDRRLFDEVDVVLVVAFGREAQAGGAGGEQLRLEGGGVVCHWCGSFVCGVGHAASTVSRMTV